MSPNSSDKNNKPDQTDKTVVIQGESETLRIEKEKAKAQGACLIVIRGVPQGKKFEITKPRMFLGRDAIADIVIADQNVSRKHVELIQDGDQIKIRDNKSTNGTYLNDKLLKDEVYLRKEDMIKIGNTILKFLPQGELEVFYWGTLESAAHTDALTQTYNKGYIMEALEAEFKRAKALHHDFSMIIFDLDHFKNVNDKFGHDAGDFVLKTTCEILKKSVLPKDSLFGRFGGEEFMVLLPNSGIEGALPLGESIRKTIEKHSYLYEEKKIPVTASVGVTELSLDVETSSALFKLADKAVYSAKSGGRNQVRTS